MKTRKPKILLVGGGTLGSVSPLLAIAQKCEAEYLFVGSQTGPEEKIIKAHNIYFRFIKSGKLRRYWSWQNFTDIFKIKIAFWQSIFIILKFKPDIVLTAGSFVAVPMALAAWLLRVPVIVHQQDIVVGLANKLMAPFARKITVSFPQQRADFNHKKVVVTGNPARQLETNVIEYRPIVVITGGGQGARGMNEFIMQFIPKLSERYEVHHILGHSNYDQKLNLENYFAYKEVVHGMLTLLARAEIIISRAGMSLITEAASLKKALVLIPMPDSHQERNAAFFAKNNAAIMVRQGSSNIMERYLDKLMRHANLRSGLADNLYNLYPHNAVNDYIILINKIIYKK